MKNSSKAKAALDAQEKLPLDEDLDNENEEGDLSQEGMAESDAAMLEDAKANVAQDDLIGIVMGNDNPDANETGSAPEQGSEHEPEVSDQQSKPLAQLRRARQSCKAQPEPYRQAPYSRLCITKNMLTCIRCVQSIQSKIQTVPR